MFMYSLKLLSKSFISLLLLYIQVAVLRPLS